MNTSTLTNKPAGQLTAQELKALLAETENAEANERKKKREAYESLKDETTGKLTAAAMQMHIALKQFKAASGEDLATMYKLLQEHSSRHADGKGSFTLENSQSTMKIMFKRQDNTRFDERATQADKHITDFLIEEFGDLSDPKAKALRKLLERDKGNVDKDNVLLLISMKDDFDNPHWRKGIELYQESIVPGETRYYTQFFTRADEGDNWQPIVLDFARL